MKIANHSLSVVIAAGLFLQGASTTLAQNPPSLDDIHWYLTDSYCSFSRVDHTFNYNDPESWRYIFMTGFGNGTDGELGYARLDGRLRELQEVKRFREGSDEIIMYQTWDKNPYLVTISRAQTSKGTESTDYTGHILVERNGVGKATPFKGDCGV